jgi:DNA invertase Pin-like site-specific DNA recombinase
MGKEYIGYCRVSTTKQGISGLGLEAQQEALRQYVHQVGGTLVAEHVEIESGKVSTRPILAQAISECRKRRGVLLIAKLDRLSRSVAFTSALMETDVPFIACDMPEANRFQLHLMAAFGEYEREQISVRTKAALAAAKARGVVLGTHGRKLADQQIANASAFAETLRPLIERLLNGDSVRLQDVADGLNKAAIATREGGKWGAASAQRVMLRLNLRTAAMV